MILFALFDPNKNKIATSKVNPFPPKNKLKIIISKSDFGHG